jgi:hypothetical protein
VSRGGDVYAVAIRQIFIFIRWMSSINCATWWRPLRGCNSTFFIQSLIFHQLDELRSMCHVVETSTQLQFDCIQSLIFLLFFISWMSSDPCATWLRPLRGCCWPWLLNWLLSIGSVKLWKGKLFYHAIHLKGQSHENSV